MKSIQRVAILGGVRIPFARQNTAYVDASNTDMMTAALKGVVDRLACRASGSAKSPPGRC
jgi:acetyl-CoA C-acetyltransferase